MTKSIIELQAPDISRWEKGNTGVPYAWQFDSGKPGPTVMVQALTHGNEICGAIALDWFLAQGFRPEAGKLTITFGNIAAFARWDPEKPSTNRYVDQDLNRVWGDDALKSDKVSVELTRARELVRFVDEADFLLDIHSMHEPCAPLMVCGAAGQGADKTVEMSKRLGVPQYLMYDTGHPMGLRMIERGEFADPASPKVGILVECGQHWEKLAADVAQDTLMRFLVDTGTLSLATAEPHFKSELHYAGRQRVIAVTEAVVAKSLDFRFVQPFTGLEVLKKKGDPIAMNGQESVTAPYDNTVLVMPAVAKQWTIGTTMVRLGKLIEG